MFRIEEVMRRLQERMPSMSEAERGMKRDLEAMEEKLEVYKRSVKQVFGGELVHGEVI